MTMTMANGNGWRIAGWALIAGLLALPAVAMRYTGEVNWTGSDFVFAAVMLGALGLGFELVARASSSWWYRAGLATALLGAFLLVWINLAVGIIGTERDDANFLFAGVLAVGVGGACLGRLSAAGMARTMIAVALAHALVAGIALVGRLGAGGPSWPWDVVGTTVLFVGGWLTSALLFRRAASAR